ncbi:MAG: EutP/PduV family microcompartment system protein [Cellulosilyticaceae bacterium]
MGKKVIFMGKTGCGKTTLCQKLDELEIKYKKTQAVEHYDNAIDTPGEYMENRNYYSALIMTAVDAEIIALIADPLEEECYLPPAFAGSFAKEVIGIITKIALVEETQQVEQVEDRLRQAGATKIFKVDTIKGTGIEPLFEYLNQVLKSN